MVLERTIFKFCQYIFRYFVINKNPWKFIWTKLNSFHIRILCAKFGWNRPSGSGEEKKTKIWKVYNNSDKNDNDDDGQILFRKAHIGLDELKSEIGIVSINCRKDSGIVCIDTINTIIYMHQREWIQWTGGLKGIQKERRVGQSFQSG